MDIIERVIHQVKVDMMGDDNEIPECRVWHRDHFEQDELRQIVRTPRPVEKWWGSLTTV